MKHGILVLMLGLSVLARANTQWKLPGGIFDHPYIEARKKAFDTKKALLIYFVSDDCTKCAEQRQMIENDVELAKALETRFETAVVNVDEFDGNAIRQIYNVQHTPGYLLVATNGEILWQYHGHISKNDLIALANGDHHTALPEGDASLDQVPRENQPVPGAKKESIEQKTKSEPTTPQGDQQLNLAVPAFQIQFGFFGNRDNARKLQEKLAETGQKDCYIEEEIRNGKTFYRVLSPLYSTEVDAEMILGLIKQKGMEGTIRQIQ